MRCTLPSPFPARDRVRGFTTIELVVVTSIIAVLAAMALPASKKVVTATRTGAVINDFRIFANAFQTYAQQNSGYPAEAAAGVMPTGMEDVLRSTAWLKATPIGGHYNWDHNVSHGGTVYRAAISIRSLESSSVIADLDQLLSIDGRIDDGDLTTGSFLLGAGNEPVFIIER